MKPSLMAYAYTALTRAARLRQSSSGFFPFLSVHEEHVERPSLLPEGRAADARSVTVWCGPMFSTGLEDAFDQMGVLMVARCAWYHDSLIVRENTIRAMLYALAFVMCTSLTRGVDIEEELIADEIAPVMVTPGTRPKTARSRMTEQPFSARP